MGDEKSASMSRRRVLGGAAALAGAGALTGMQAFGAPHPRRRRSLGSHTDFNVIVIGGGFAGLTAARDLSKNGLSTLVLEAKGRLGGRTFDTQFRDHHIELGGAWVHWAQPAVWSEIQRYGLEIEQMPAALPDQISLLTDQGRTTFGIADHAVEVVGGMEAYFAESATVWERPYDTKYCWKEILARDSMSSADRLKAIELTPIQRGFLVPMLEAMSNCPAEQSSYVDMLRWWALGMNHWSTAMDAADRFKLAAGTGALVRKIAGDSRAEVRLNSPVQRVEQRGGVVHVWPRNGKPVSARAVVVAVPPRLLKSIQFEPALSAGKMAVSRDGFAPSGIKLYAELKGRLGKVQWLASGAKQTHGYFMTYHEGETSTLIAGFCPVAAEVDGNDEESVQAMLRRFDPSVEVLGCTSYAWNADPYAQGTYSGMRPGVMSQHFFELAKTEGRIYMAGSEYGDASWRGFIDGAIGRGSRIAHEISTELLG